MAGQKAAILAVHLVQEIVSAYSHVIESGSRTELLGQFLFYILIDIQTTELVGEADGCWNPVADQGCNVPDALPVIVETFYLVDSPFGEHVGGLCREQADVVEQLGMVQRDEKSVQTSH